MLAFALLQLIGFVKTSRASKELTLKASLWRWGILALIYGVFFVWYGGSGEPISSQEAERYLSLAQARPVSEDNRDKTKRDRLVKLHEFIAEDDGQEFVMVNLNVYREQPLYADGRAVIGSAQEAELEYQRRIVPHLFVRAIHPLLMVDPVFSFGGIGDFDRQDWSRITLVRYRSRRDFLDFILKTSWGEDVDHKWAALDRSHALAATPLISFATVRLVPLLFLIVIGLLLDRVSTRSHRVR